MTTWTKSELDRIGNAEEIEIAPRRGDGSLQKSVTIWIVRAGDDLYVRSYLGLKGKWFRNALARHEGQVQAGGLEKEVVFVEVTDPEVNNQIDTAYREKYRRYPGDMNAMITPEVRITTLKLLPG